MVECIFVEYDSHATDTKEQAEISERGHFLALEKQPLDNDHTEGI